MAVILPATPLPQSSDIERNPFLTNGPKGFTESKMIGSNSMFVRTDLPGIGQDDFTVAIDDSKKGVIIRAEEQTCSRHDSSRRNYVTFISLHCHCCEISRFHNTQVTDGVLRLLISTTPSNINGVGSALEDTHGRPVSTEPKAKGPETAYEYKHLPDGSLYVRLDMPGVPQDKFNAYVENGRVTVTGEAPAISHDSSSREYSADAALLSCPLGTDPSPRVERKVVNGVMRLIIRPT
ncbi:Heat shock protein HSP20/alpha crystallin family [Raphanus sativus]|uniref:57 kDa heat shock protein n=1 Tax=Raphanus sativus TaxID=3726 RepID=A0A6J0N587_RAPSA|nr:putative 57 kDa heat shock protein [Raphanus sativus]KAJ4868841.1 Heat shock protein HSP20/alpha crystallin family [Raphanus sativus]